MIAYVAALVSLFGLVLFLALNSAATNKAQQIGLHMFWCGLLVLLLHLASYQVRVFP